MKKALTLLAFTSVGLTSVCQNKLDDYSLIRNVSQDELKYQFTVLDNDKKGVRKYDPEKTYHWYKTQRVMTTQGGASGDLLHGDYSVSYDNKQLKQKGKFKKGLKTGHWSYWNEEGKLIKTEKWKCGELNGKMVLYDEFGKEISTTYYKKGSLSEQKGPKSLWNRLFSRKGKTDSSSEKQSK